MAAEGLFGTLPPRWECTTLAEACARGGGDVQTGPFGSQLHASDYVAVGIPAIMPENLSDDRVSTNGIAYVTEDDARRLGRYRVQAGDIVYSRRGDVTKRALVRKGQEGWLCGTGCLRVRFGGKHFDPRYAFYYTGHPLVKEWISRHAIGATLPNLNTSILSALPVVLPPAQEQRAIAHILGTLDDKIELNRQMNETLEAMARALFKAWFVDFEPVRVKMEGRWKRGQSLPGLPAHLFELLPARLEDSEDGPIPVGWSRSSILAIARLLSGGTPSTDRKEYWNGSICWASAKDISQCGEAFIVTTERTISESGLRDSATQLIPALCTAVVARGATTGRMAIFGREMAMNQTCYALASTTETPFTLYCLLRHETASLIRSAHGSVFDTITTSTFAASKLLLPPEIILQRFETRITPVFRRILANIQESLTLASIRDGLLPKLISGGIRVKTAEAVASSKA